MRLIPLGFGLAPCERLLVSHDTAHQHMPGSWEIGRLVLAPEFRAGPELLKRCLYLTVLALVDQSVFNHLFASCTPVLGRLYRRFGFTTLLKDAGIGPEGSYSLIHGALPTVFRAVADDAEREGVERRLGVLYPN